MWKLLPSARVLVCAPSNSAADLVGLRIIEHVPKNEVLRLYAYSRKVEDIPENLKVKKHLHQGTMICTVSTILITLSLALISGLIQRKI